MRLAATLALLTVACGGAPSSLGSVDPMTDPAPAASSGTPAEPLSTPDAGTVNQTVPPTMSPFMSPTADAGPDHDSAPDAGSNMTALLEAGSDATPDTGTAEYCAPGVPAECYLECAPSMPWQCISNGKQGYRWSCKFEIPVPNGASVHSLAGDIVGTYPPSGGNCWTP